MMLVQARASIEGLGVGILALEHRHETCNVLTFHCQSDALLGILGALVTKRDYDLDDLERIDTSRRTLIIRSHAIALTVIKVLQRDEFCCLQTAIDHCRRLRDLSLRQMIVTSDILAAIGRAVPSPVGFERYGLHLIMTTRKRAIVVCFYCGRDKQSISSGLFFLHPWVPCDFSRREIIFCEICLHNWRMHREDRIPSSGHERRCSICSAVPRAMKPCSRCPRSFCKDCLQELLDATALMQTRNSTDWTCMACFYQLPSELSSTLYVVETSVSLSGLDIYQRAARREAADTRALHLELFREYVLQHPEVRRQAERGTSEDFCFVCKDGGDLLECDEQLCGKVFHQECLVSPLPSSADDAWSCPRHLCAVCGSNAVSFACLYCPSSFCSPCCENGLRSDSLQLFQVLRRLSFELPGSVTSVICSPCLETAKKAFSPENFDDLQLSWSLHLLWSDEVRGIAEKTKASSVV